MSEPLHQRFGLAFMDFIGTTITSDARAEAARAIVHGMTFRKQDEDTAITPESDATKGPRLIVAVTDNGRVKPYAPIRILRATIAVRALTVTPGATKQAAGAMTATAFNALCGALEYLLDSRNLKATLTSQSREIATMLCTRQPGTTPTRIRDGIREDTYALDIRAVPLEFVTVTFDSGFFTFDSTARTFDRAA